MSRSLMKFVCLIAVMCGGLLFVATAFDSFEFEVTGRCGDCLVLPHLAERFRD